MLSIYKKIRRSIEHEHIGCQESSSYINNAIKYNWVQSAVERQYPPLTFEKTASLLLPKPYYGDLSGGSSIFQVSYDRQENSLKCDIILDTASLYDLPSNEQADEFYKNQCWENFLVINELGHYAKFLRDGLIDGEYDEVLRTASIKTLQTLRQTKTLRHYVSELSFNNNLSDTIKDEYLCTIGAVELLLPFPIRKFFQEKLSNSNSKDWQLFLAYYFCIPVALVEGACFPDYIEYVENNFNLYEEKRFKQNDLGILYSEYQNNWHKQNNVLPSRLRDMLANLQICK